MKYLSSEKFLIKMLLKKLSELSILKICLKISRIFYNNNFSNISILILKILEKISLNNFYIQVEFSQVYKKIKDSKNLIKTYDKAISFTKGHQKMKLYLWLYLIHIIF